MASSVAVTSSAKAFGPKTSTAPACLLLWPIGSAPACDGMRKTGRVHLQGTSSGTRLPTTPSIASTPFDPGQLNIGRRMAGCGYVDPNKLKHATASCENDVVYMH